MLLFASESILQFVVCAWSSLRRIKASTTVSPIPTKSSCSIMCILSLLIKVSRHIMEQLDFVGIGDTVVDAFIRLREDQAHTTNCKIDSDAAEICMPFGAKIPYDFVNVIYAVGNSPSGAVSPPRRGKRSVLITILGKEGDDAETAAFALLP